MILRDDIIVREHITGDAIIRIKTKRNLNCFPFSVSVSSALPVFYLTKVKFGERARIFKLQWRILHIERRHATLKDCPNGNTH
jgi:hypothetical protein